MNLYSIVISWGGIEITRHTRHTAKRTTSGQNFTTVEGSLDSSRRDESNESNLEDVNLKAGLLQFQMNPKCVAVNMFKYVKKNRV